MDSPTPEPSDALPEEHIYDDFLDALEAGEAPSVDEFLAAQETSPSHELRLRLEALSRHLGRGTKRPSEIGGLIVKGVLGSGGMGEVLAAYDPGLDRYVAVKLVLPALAKNPLRVERLKKEARILAALEHPNVATIYSLGGTTETTGEALHIVMELVDGSDLATYMASEARDWETALPILEQLASALSAAHDRQIIHRDLKPSNVMRKPDGTIKVLDFGLSSRISSAGPDRGRVESSDGTPGYMSPEQAAGAPQDERADVWAFGCIAYELVMNALPPKTRPLGFSNGVPRPVAKLIGRCLALDPTERPDNGGALCAELLRLRHGLGQSSSTAAALPRYRTQFVDSEHRKAQVLDHLAGPGLVTLVGPAGSGKTRLAVEIADAMGGGFWVDLAAAMDDTLAEVLAHAVGIRGDLSIGSVAQHLGADGTLLVLDNCEHLLPAVSGIIETLLTNCPRLRILATSRERMGVSAELTFNLGPLGHGDGVAQPADAVALFVDRARASGCVEVRPISNGLVAPGVLADIRVVCRQLDGLPLAIEMAAARAATVGLKALAQRTGDSLSLIRSTTDVGPERHRSMENAIRTSVDALDPNGRRLLMSLSAFEGGWSLSLLEEMVGAQVRFDAEDVLDTLARLTRASLVAREPATGRWRLLQTIRTFAAAELRQSPDLAAEIHLAHTATLLALGDRARLAELAAERVAAFRDLEAELPNFLLAIERSAASSEDAQRSALLVANLFEFWISRGLMPMGLRVLKSAMIRAPDLPNHARAQCSLSLGTLAQRTGQSDEAYDYLRVAVNLARASNTRPLMARTLRNLAFFAMAHGRFGEAREGFASALAIELPLGDPLRLGNLRNDLGILANYEGRYSDAVASYGLGLELRTQARSAWGIASSLGNLGESYHRLGDLARARAHLSRSLQAFHELDDLRSVVESLEMSASVEVSAGRFERAARLAGTAAQYREKMAFPKPAPEQEPYAAELALAKEALGTTQFNAHKTEGVKTGIDQMVEWVLAQKR